MDLKQLDKKLDKFHLLKHPFYVAWNNGELKHFHVISVRRIHYVKILSSVKSY